MKPSPEIAEIARRFREARARGDVDVVNGMFSNSDHLRVIGSREREWYRGPEELHGINKAHLEEAARERLELLRVEAFEDGEVGWAAVEEKRTLPNGGGTVFRLTLVFRLEGGTWKIVHSHFSAPIEATPNRREQG